MTDEEALVQMVLANAQGEMSPLEVGVAALRYVELEFHHKQGPRSVWAILARHMVEADWTAKETEKHVKTVRAMAVKVHVDMHLCVAASISPMRRLKLSWSRTPDPAHGLCAGSISARRRREGGREGGKTVGVGRPGLERRAAAQETPTVDLTTV